MITAADIAQLAASNPESSVWVSAHAGSGKTSVLSKRVTRLLLRGTPPGAILCLTYTKAAAANMANRIYDTLAQWVKLSDAELSQKIYELDGFHPSDVLLQKARRLFAESLETPGGLKVQTIHAFAGAILRKFPLEADVPADFTELDALNATRLREEALRLTLSTPHLKQPLMDLAILCGDGTLDDIFYGMIDKRRVITGFFTECDEDFTRVYETLAERLGTSKTINQLNEEVFSQSPFSMTDMKDWGERLASFTSANEVKLATKFRRFYANPTQNNYYYSLVLNQDFSINKRNTTKAIATKYPDFIATLKCEAERLSALLVELKSAKIRDLSFALMQIAISFIHHYELAKRAESFLDFDDLIVKTANLLNNGATAWVNYKLDQSIDHILVDEAQDTSPAQWDIIRAMAEEFASGKSARETKRTLFAVGDEKQSIYSFQGADPVKFDEMQHYFADKFTQSKQPFEKIPLKTSFRSSPALLSLVDEIATNPVVRQGLSPSGEIEPHIAHHDTLPGLIELWELERDLSLKNEDWRVEVDAASDNVMILANKIAKTIKEWVENGDILQGKGRAIQPKDILILMKKRGALFHAVNKALKEHHVASSGTDRLILSTHPIVLDLLNLAESLLLRDDDLALATLLRSPLFDVDEDELYSLAQGREGRLYDQLPPPLKEQFEKWRETALTLTPFAFYTQILIGEGGRTRFITRFGREAEDVLDGFIAKLTSFQSSNIPDLRGFISLMRQSNEDIKRDPDVTRNEVRVMTVHGSKGLEAPIVFLCDITAGAKGGGHRRFFEIKASGNAAHAMPLWSLKSEHDVELIINAKKLSELAEDNEYQRLLYVGLTRAEQRLILCGLEKKRVITSWHTSLSELTSFSDEIDTDAGKVKRWYNIKPDTGVTKTLSQLEMPIVLPSYLKIPMPARTPPKQRREYEPSEAEKQGILFHKLMQILPNVPLEKQDAAITRFLGLGDHGEIKRLLTHAIFKLDALTEVPISDGEREQRIDRLCYDESRVIILDYKTGNQTVITAEIKAQMQSYAQIIQPAFPDKIIEAKIAFLKTGEIVPVSLI